MPRIERLATEKLFNNSFLGRARKFIKPVNPDYEADHFLRRYPRLNILQRFTSQYSLYFDSIEYRNQRTLDLQQGLSFDDTFMEQDSQLYRCAFHENFLRQSVHPYHVNLNKHKRTAFQKIDCYLKGFEAPDYLREPAQRRTYKDTQKKLDIFHRMFTMNYRNEKTQTVFWGKGSMVVFEAVIFYGSLNRNAWNRFFFNEEIYVSFHEVLQEDMDAMGQKKLNLWDAEERVKFEKHITWLNKLYPGYYAPDGENIDFEEMVSDWQKKNPFESFDKNFSDQELMELFGYQNNKKPYILSEHSDVIEEAEPLSGKNTVGIKIPEYLSESKRSTSMI